MNFLKLNVVTQQGNSAARSFAYYSALSGRFTVVLLTSVKSYLKSYYQCLYAFALFVFDILGLRFWGLRSRICVFEVCVLETPISGGTHSLSDATLAMARLLQDLFFYLWYRFEIG